MNIDIEQVRRQMLELHRRELEGLEVFAGALERARQFGLAQPAPPAVAATFPAAMMKQHKTPKRAKPGPAVPAGKTEKAAGRGQRGEMAALFEAVVAQLPEPFTVGSAKAAFLAAHPQHEQWTINIPGALLRWRDAHLLERTAGGGHRQSIQLPPHQTMGRARRCSLHQGTGLPGFSQHPAGRQN